MTDVANTKSTIDERLENIFRQLLDLYERHAQERQSMIKEKEELVRLVQLLVAQTKEVGQYEQVIRKLIQECIKEAADAAVQSIELKMTDTNSSLVEQFHQSIRSLIKESGEQHLLFSWKVMIAALISGAIVMMLFTWVLMR